MVIDNREANDKLDELFSKVMIDKVREAIRKERGQWLNSDNWAVYINPEDRRELIGDWGGPKIYSEGAWGADEFRSIDDVDIYVDRCVDEPVVLPKDAQMMPSDLKLQKNPPLHLVQQLVDPTQTEDSTSGFRHMHLKSSRMYTLKDTFFFEVRSIEYVVFIDQLSTDLHCPRLHTMLGKVSGSKADWSFERRSSSWVFGRQFDVGEEVRKFPFTHQATSEDLTAVNVERQFAEDVIETIGGEVTSPIYGRREVVKSEQDVGVVPDEELSCSMNYETETERVRVGEKRSKLGRLYIQ